MVLWTYLSPPSGPTCPMRHGCPDSWTWDQNDKSHEIKLHGKENKLAHFHPNWSNGTAGIRGTMSLNYGRHYWEIHVSQRIFGTSMMFGIGTKKSRVHVDSFVNLLGEDTQSWGLSHKGLLWHNGRWRRYTKPFRENEPTVIGIYLDWHLGTLTYYKDGCNLGVAFTGLSKVEDELYPMVSSTAAKTEMTLGMTRRSFYNLQDRCRAVVAETLRNNDTTVDDLPLPVRLKLYIEDLFP